MSDRERARPPAMSLQALRSAVAEAKDGHIAAAMRFYRQAVAGDDDLPLPPLRQLLTQLHAAEHPDEAEEVAGKLIACAPEEPIGYLGLARAAQQKKLRALAAERWDVVVQKFGAQDVEGRWRLACARAHESNEAWSRALEIWQELQACPPSSAAAAMGVAKCLLKQDRHEQAEQALEALLQRECENAWALKMYAAAATRKKQYATAFMRWRNYLQVQPDDLLGYQQAANVALNLKDAEALKALVDGAPESVAGSRSFQSGPLLALHRARGDRAQVIAIIDALGSDPLERDEVVRIANSFFDVLEYKRCADFMGREIGRFADDATAWRLYLRAIRQGADSGTIESCKRAMRAALNAEDFAKVLRSLPPALMSTEEAIAVIDHCLKFETDEQKKSKELAVLAFSNNAAVIAHLSECLRQDPALSSQISGELLLSRIHDLQRLTAANLRPMAWTDFAAEAQQLNSRIDSLLAGDTSDPLLKASLQSALHIAKSAQAAWLGSAQSYFEAASAAAWLLERIRKKIPTSLIRIGDGEGTFLPYAAEYAAYQHADQTFMQKIWWGASRLGPEQAEGFSENLQTALKNADALGVPPLKRLLVNVPGRDEGVEVRGVASILNYFQVVSPELSRDKVIMSCHIHTDWDHWDLYRSLFRELSAVSYISCHELDGFLLQRFGLRVQRKYRIPAEHAWRTFFGHDESASESFYPTVFNRIMAELAPEPGEVFLVGAGIAGKLLCERIRERGGIALDLGSVMDLWAGFATRRAESGDFRFDPSTALIQGQPFSRELHPAALAGEPCLSNETRQRNIFRDLEQAGLRKAQAGRSYPLLVTGHPRCGSAYTAEVFKALGFDLKHERYGADGTCSWLHVAGDLAAPYGDNDDGVSEFRNVVAYVRDPRDALPSIMLENTVELSFSFRRFHIFRRLGRDIAARQNALERAIESYLSWMEIVDQCRPCAVIHAERPVEDLRSILRDGILIDRPVDPARFAAVEQLPKDVNASSNRFFLSKPVLSVQDYQNVAADLQQRLRDFCSRYGYADPMVA